MKNLLLLAMLAFAGINSSAQCGSPGYDPQFTISVQNPACPTESEIKVTTTSGGVGPYSYTLMPGNISNSTGTFTNIAAGTYTVQMKDACGTIRARQATITPYNISCSSSITSLGCNVYRFEISSPFSSTGLDYGYSINGAPIIWGDSSSILLTLP